MHVLNLPVLGRLRPPYVLSMHMHPSVRKSIAPYLPHILLIAPITTWTTRTPTRSISISSCSPSLSCVISTPPHPGMLNVFRPIVAPMQFQDGTLMTVSCCTCNRPNSTVLPWLSVHNYSLGRSRESAFVDRELNATVGAGLRSSSSLLPEHCMRCRWLEAAPCNDMDNP